MTDLIVITESSALIPLDVQQLQHPEDLQLHNLDKSPNPVVHLKLYDMEVKQCMSWQRKVCLAGSQADLIIHTYNKQLEIPQGNFLNFKSVSLEHMDAKQELENTALTKTQELNASRIDDAKKLLNYFAKNPRSTAPDTTAVERLLHIPQLYFPAIVLLRNAVIYSAAVLSSDTLECIIEHLATNLNAKTAEPSAFFLSSLSEKNQYLQDLDITKLVTILCTCPDHINLHIEKILNNLISKGVRPGHEISGVLQYIIDRNDNAAKVKICEQILTTIDKLSSEEAKEDDAKENDIEAKVANEPDTLDPRFNNEDLKDATKSLEALLAEISQKNNYDTAKIESFRALFKHITEEVYAQDSKIEPQEAEINTWDATKIGAWASAVRGSAKGNDPDFIPDVLAVIKRAVFLDCGYEPREVQILSLLMFAGSIERGMLAQISTGEGKSTITAMLAVIKALQGQTPEGQKVDIVTSSPVLAKRDASEKSKFFRMFNLTVGHNCDQQDVKGFKECYTKDIVYGDISSFQYDVLRHEYQQKGTRGDRTYATVIVDEVDSMSIDDNAKLAMLSSHTPATEYLEPLLGIAASELDRFNQHVVYSKEDEAWVYVNGAFTYEDGKIVLENEESQIYNIPDIWQFRFEHLKSHLTKVIEEGLIAIPKHLRGMALKQAEPWIKSSISAMHYTGKKDYMILRDDRNNAIVAPIDYQNTGLIHAKTTWTDGLHQFLQIKHGLKITPENLVTSFISNLSYLKRYGKNIYGMTGTLGSHDSQELLKSIYDVDVVSIPTYKPKKFVRGAEEGKSDDTLCSNRAEWISTVALNTYAQSSKGRAVLVICETIQNAELVREAMSSHYPESRTKLYSRNDTNESQVVEEIVDSGDIIIATNLAGRGTDLKTTREVEEKGGLHVAVTFLPSNLRVEEQAFGRTARQGNKGSGELIINREEANQLLGIEENEISARLEVEDYKDLRDQREQAKLSDIKLYDEKRIILEDELFKKFSDLTHRLKAKENSKSKLAQLEENWGIALKEIKREMASARQQFHEAGNELPAEIESLNITIREQVLRKFAEFERQMTAEYNSGYQIIQNPAHLVTEGFNTMATGDYGKATELFQTAASLDDAFSSAAHYNAAYSTIQGKVGNYKQDAVTHLEYAKAAIEGVLIPNLEVLQITAVKNQDSPLAKQIVKKIELLKLQLKYINLSQSKILSCASENEIEIAENTLFRDFFDSNNTPEDEILELNQFGIHALFDVKEVEPPTDVFGAVFLAIGSIVQIGLGVALAMTGNIGLGASLIIGGVQDAMQAIEVATDGKQVKWGEYFTRKGIEAAVAIISVGVEKLMVKMGTVSAKGVLTRASGALTKDAVKISLIQAAEKTGVKVTEKAVQQELLKMTMKEIAKRVVVNAAIDKVASKAMSNVLAEFKEEIRGKVESGINECIDNPTTRDQLTSLLEIDAINGNNHNYNSIMQAALSALKHKQNVLSSIISRTVNELASNSTMPAAVQGVATAVKYAGMGSALIEVSNLTDELQDKLTTVIANLSQHSPNIAGILESKLKHIITLDKAKEIVSMLEQKGYIANNRLIKTEGLEDFDYTPGKNEITKSRIIDIFKKIHAAQHRDHTATKQKIKDDLKLSFSKAMSGTIRSEIMMPAASSYLSDLSNLAAKGAAKVASDFAKAAKKGIRGIEAMIAESANKMAEAKMTPAYAGGGSGGAYELTPPPSPSSRLSIGVASGDGLPDEPTRSSSKAKAKDAAGSANNNKEWVNPDEPLMSLMRDPSRLTDLRKETEQGRGKAQAEASMTPETALWVGSLLNAANSGQNQHHRSAAGSRGDPISVDLDHLGNVVRETYADGSVVDYDTPKAALPLPYDQTQAALGALQPSHAPSFIPKFDSAWDRAVAPKSSSPFALSSVLLPTLSSSASAASPALPSSVLEHKTSSADSASGLNIPEGFNFIESSREFMRDSLSASSFASSSSSSVLLSSTELALSRGFDGSHSSLHLLSSSASNREPTALAKRADELGEWLRVIEANQESADFIVTATSILAKGATGAAAGSIVPGVGTAAGFVAGLGAGITSELYGLAVNVVAGDAISAGIELAAEKAALGYKISDPTLSDEQAAILGTASVLGAGAALSVKGALKDVTKLIGRIKLKMPTLPSLHPELAVAGMGGLEHGLFKAVTDGAEYTKPQSVLFKGKHKDKYDIGGDSHKPHDIDRKPHGDIFKGALEDFGQYIDSIETYQKPDHTKIELNLNTYHGARNVGDKSKLPQNSHKTLENAYKVKSSSRQLIGIDIENKELVIFRYENANIYHPHTIAVKVLRPEHKKALENIYKNNEELLKQILNKW